MNIRKAWNLWNVFLMPWGFLILGYMAPVLRAWWMFVVALIWLFWALHIIKKKCSCPKCKHLLRPFEYEELSMFTWYYWPAKAKLKCKRCGELLE